MRLAAAVIEDGDDRCIIPELVPLSQRECRSALATTSWRDEDAMKKSVLMEIEEITQIVGHGYTQGHAEHCEKIRRLEVK